VLQGKQVRALAITGDQPSPSFPDLKPIAALGYPDYNAAGWWAYAVPKGTPQPIIDKLNKAISKTLKDPEFAQRFSREGLDIIASTPDAATQFVHDDIATWKKVVQQFNIEKLGG